MLLFFIAQGIYTLNFFECPCPVYADSTLAAPVWKAAPAASKAAIRLQKETLMIKTICHIQGKLGFAL